MIVPPKGKYGVSVYDKTLGRKRWVGAFDTKREAREAEREALRSSGARGSETCGHFARWWLTDYPREAAASRKTYRYAIQGFRRTSLASGCATLISRRHGGGLGVGTE